MQTTPFELRKVRDLGEVINDTLVFIKLNLKPLLKAYLVICGFFIAASLASNIVNQIRIFNVIEEGALYTARNPLTSILNPLYFLAIIFKLITYMMIELTAIGYIAAYAGKGGMAPTVEEVWGFVKYYFFRVLGASIVVGLIVGIAFLFCVIPGVYLWPMLSLVMPIIIIENGELGYAMSRSFRLVKDNYWMTLGVLFVMLIIVIAGNMIFTIPISIFTIGSLFTTGHKLSYTGSILTMIASHICMVFYMLISIAITLNYYSLVEKKEGAGLMERINSLGQKDNNTSDHSSEQY
ncbi:MAG: hypothetical protein ACTHJ0_15535 [Flavipsychrobacter sp.]